MKNMFICSTQYQLFNAINIIESKYTHDENFLVVLDCCFGLTEKLKSIAERSEYFCKIIDIHSGPLPGTVKGYLYFIYRFLFPASIYNDKMLIDRVFIVSTEVYSRIIACHLLKKQKSIQLFYFEDGLGSYTTVLSNKTRSMTNKLLNIKYGFFLIEKCSGMFVYKPEYVHNNPYHIDLYRINEIIVNSKYAIFLSNIFSGTEPERNFDEKILYFDSHFKIKIDITNTQSIELLLKQVLKNNFVIKPHPSAMQKWCNDNVKFFRSRNAFETYLLKRPLNKTILISCFSTACLTPKLIFNEEPRVVFLYKLYDNYSSWKQLDIFFQKVKASYLDANDFIIPETKEELVSVLTKWTETEPNKDNE